MNIVRQTYLNEILKWKNKHEIKILTGVRRSGKSTILIQYMDLLKTKFAIENKQVIYYDFSDPLLDDVNYKLLYEEILNKSQPNDINYIFLDEIQEVKNFEKCVIGLFENKTFRFDIYLTGSNSKMLSSELATLFTGRYQEIKIYPLSFSEYLLVVSNILQKFDKHDLFNQYLLYGGLPGIIEVIKDTTLIQKKVNKVIDDVINKDIKKRHKLRITNAPEFDRICKFLFENIGGVISIENIEKYLKSNNKSRISANTIDRYLAWLCEALLIYRVNYWDVKGKRIMRTSGKYYSIDTGIRNAQNGFNPTNQGMLLENIVYIELLRRGYDVYTLKLRSGKEIDFVAIKGNETQYVQVTQTLKTEKTIKREKSGLEQIALIDSLLSIKDNYRKILISELDRTQTSPDGIEIINLIDWLDS